MKGISAALPSTYITVHKLLNYQIPQILLITWEAVDEFLWNFLSNGQPCYYALWVDSVGKYACNQVPSICVLA